MKITQLPEHWTQPKAPRKESQERTLKLPLEDAARIAALSEMYPDRDENEILSDMIAAALDTLSESNVLKDRLQKN